MWRSLRNAFEVLAWRCPARPVFREHPFRRGKHVALVWSASSLVRRPAREVTIYAGVIDVSRITARYGVTPAMAAELLPESFALPAALPSAGRGAYRLDLAITEMVPARWWAHPDTTLPRMPAALSPLLLLAWFGVGHAWLQVEGELRHASGGPPVAAFVQPTRRSSLAESLHWTWWRDEAGSLQVLCAQTVLAILSEAAELLTTRERA